MTATTGRPDDQKRAYLEAIGITTWVLRDSNAAAAAQTTPAPVLTPVSKPELKPVLKLGPGRGGTLLVCARDSDSASRLANDISRSLSSVPVWAWPAEPGAGRVTLAGAVKEYLFTSVAVFGAELAASLFAGDVPGNTHTAKLIQLPAMRDLERDSAARRELWKVLCRSGMVAKL